jgi:hypothetical protein
MQEDGFVVGDGGEQASAVAEVKSDAPSYQPGQQRTVVLDTLGNSKADLVWPTGSAILFLFAKCRADGLESL